MISVEFKGLDELQKNIKNHPEKANTEIQKYLVRAQAVITGIYSKNPWRVGGGGGGVPVLTGNLLKKGTPIQIEPFRRIFFVDGTRVDYANVVYADRPWLEYASETGQKDIDNLQIDLLNNLAENLTK